MRSTDRLVDVYRHSRPQRSVKMLRYTGMQETVLVAISSFDRQRRMFIQMGGAVTGSVSTKRGVLQGCSASVILLLVIVKQSSPNTEAGVYAGDRTLWIRQDGRVSCSGTKRQVQQRRSLERRLRCRSRTWQNGRDNGKQSSGQSWEHQNQSTYSRRHPDHESSCQHCCQNEQAHACRQADAQSQCCILWSRTVEAASEVP